MKKQVQLDEQTLHSIESCRAGYEDLSHPAMSHLAAKIAANPDLEKLFDRIQFLDAKIGAAFHDVSVPPGLDKRILDVLAHAPAEISATAVENKHLHETAGIVTPCSSPARGKRWVSRRWILAAGGMLSAAAILFIALWINFHNQESISEQTALDESIRFFDADAAGGGFPVAERPAPKAYPFSRAVVFSAGTGWREIHDLLGRAGIAYDLPRLGGARAVLYVIEQSIEGLGNEPQFQPFTTGGYSASAWQEGGLLYVLVVQGEPQTFRKYLVTPRGPVA